MKAGPIPRLLPILGVRHRLAPYCWSWPDEVTRPYCYLADMRSIAASGILLWGAHDIF